jgi:hypothetical protein
LLELRIPSVAHALAFEWGYLLQDTFMEVCVYRYTRLRAHGDHSVVLHHLAILAAIPLHLFLRKGDYYVAVLMTMLLSDAMMQAFVVADKLNRPLIVTILKVLYPVVFILCRFGIFPLIFVRFARNRLHEFEWWQAPLHLSWYCQAGIVSFVAFNTWLGYRIVSHIARRSK